MRETMRARMSEWHKHRIWPRVLIVDGIPFLQAFDKHDPWHFCVPTGDTPEHKEFLTHLRTYFLLSVVLLALSSHNLPAVPSTSPTPRNQSQAVRSTLPGAQLLARATLSSTLPRSLIALNIALISAPGSLGSIICSPLAASNRLAH